MTAFMTKAQKKSKRIAVRKTYLAEKERKHEAERTEIRRKREEAERIAAIRLKEDQEFFKDFLGNG